MHFFDRLNAHVTRRVPLKAFGSLLRRSIVSITFDDFAESAWRVGGPILAQYRAPATYYVSGSLCGMRSEGVQFYGADDLVAAYAAGHEIGCHTYSHLDVRKFSSDKLLADINKNASFIRSTLGEVIPETFAYPFGSSSLRAKLLFARHFACCRGTEPGINHGLLDLSQLKVVSLQSSRWSADVIDHWIAKASQVPSWIIFFTHDITDSPTPWGSTPSMLENALIKTRAAGFAIMTVKNALGRACFKFDDK